jgi:AraC-like DNA-binding protein
MLSGRATTIMSHTTITTASQTLWRILESYGLDPAPVFQEAGLDPAAWNDPGSRFDDARLDTAWLRAIELSGDPCIGLRAARYFNPASLQALGFAWLASDSLYDALTRLVRYTRALSTGMELELTLAGNECCLNIGQTNRQPKAVHEILDAFWAGLINLCRISLTDRFTPARLSRYRPEPPCVADFYALFRSPIQFEAAQESMVFRRDDVERPLPTSNHLLARTNEKIVADYLARLDDNSFPDKIRARLVEILPSGEMEVELLARDFNLSQRTLQRRLAKAGTSYSELLDEARRVLALRYIGEDRLSIKETTYILGFSEPANFTRAFRRWTGVSPTQYRHRNR